MPNIIIPTSHQSAPNLRYDPVLAREAAAADSEKPDNRDWDQADWEALNPAIARRRKMRNANFDAEFDRPEHHDPDLDLLKQRAFLERIEHNPQSWVEASLELFESNCEKAERQRLPGQQRWEGKEAERQRLVNILHPHAVLRRLRSAGVDARTEEHPNARIWLNGWSCSGLVGVNAWVRPQEMDEEGYLFMLSQATTQRQRDLITDNFHACRAGRKVRKTITSLQEPCGPEWSLMHINARGVATKERFRGWRTAMLVLIVAEIVTEEEVDRAFGPPAAAPGAWYREQLQNWRQLKIGKAL